MHSFTSRIENKYGPALPGIRRLDVHSCVTPHPLTVVGQRILWLYISLTCIWRPRLVCDRFQPHHPSVKMTSYSQYPRKPVPTQYSFLLPLRSQLTRTRSPRVRLPEPASPPSVAVRLPSPRAVRLASLPASRRQAAHPARMAALLRPAPPALVLRQRDHARDAVGGPRLLLARPSRRRVPRLRPEPAAAAAIWRR